MGFYSIIFLRLTIMDNNKIGKFITSRRKEKGLTQQELGDKLFVTDKAVSGNDD